MRDYGYYKQVFEDYSYPLGFVDLDALDRNADEIRGRADGTPVRVASKSVRCPRVLHHVLSKDGFRGVMAYSGHEARKLSEEGFKDILVAYPVWHPSEVRAVCGADADVTLMVDSREHVDRLSRVAGETGAVIPVCLDLDMSYRYPGLHFGVRRSGVRGIDDAVELADYIEGAGNLRLRGLMGYEAQIAGLPDRSPANNPAVNAVIRLLKKHSAPRVLERRRRVVEALADRDLGFVNGGGTGSVEVTVRDPSVTEVTVGSGFYSPRLFDYYDAFQHEPAAGYLIEVARNPEPGVYTCRGGGYVASGPPGDDKIPEPHLPEDAELFGNEAAGEVQTPVQYSGDLELGDPVVMRHAKAGELCRHFRSLHLVRDDEVVEEAPTYRGRGWCFL